MNTDRLLHTIAVARKMVEIAKEKTYQNNINENYFYLDITMISDMNIK